MTPDALPPCQMCSGSRRIPAHQGAPEGPCPACGPLCDALEKLAAAQKEIERLKAGGCARDQRLTQHCPLAEAAERKLAEATDSRAKVVEEMLDWGTRLDTGEVGYIKPQRILDWARRLGGEK
jgi:hypothetical protein